MKPVFTHPPLSIVIPALNEEAYITDCLASLAAQNYQGKVEVIVVDNGSTDRTASIAKARGAKVIYESKRGVCAARQRGTLCASEDIIISTDADTTFSSGWLEYIGRCFVCDPAVAAVVGPYEFENPPRWARSWHKTIFGAVGFFYRRWGTVLYAPACNFAFRRVAWRASGGYNIKLAQAGDEYDLLSRLRRTGKIVFLEHNAVSTSSRRLQKGFLYNLFITAGLYYFTDYLLSRFTGKSTFGSYPPFRGEVLGRTTTLGKAVVVGFMIVALTLLSYSLSFASAAHVVGKGLHRTAAAVGLYHARACLENHRVCF